MKKKTFKKLLINKTTLTNLSKDVKGGAGTLKICPATLNTCNYSQCGTGPFTVGTIPCGCGGSAADPTCYSVCGTGPATIGGPTCC